MAASFVLRDAIPPDFVRSGGVYALVMSPLQIYPHVLPGQNLKHRCKENVED